AAGHPHGLRPARPLPWHPDALPTPGDQLRPAAGTDAAMLQDHRLACACPPLADARPRPRGLHPGAAAPPRPPRRPAQVQRPAPASARKRIEPRALRRLAAWQRESVRTTDVRIR